MKVERVVAVNNQASPKPCLQNEPLLISQGASGVCNPEEEGQEIQSFCYSVFEDD